MFLPNPFMQKPIILLSALFGLGLAFAPARSDEFSAAQKAEIQSIMKNYLLENPEVLRDAIAELENREKMAETAARQKIVSNLNGPLYGSAHQSVIGNPNGKITLIEFFDYNCGYCKRALDDLARLMKDNPDLRIVLKDFPILSPGSIEAAQIATAARNQFKGDKYWEFHQKLLASRGQVGRSQALAVAKELGADMDRLGKDAAAPGVMDGIEESEGLAKSLLMNGTPAYVIGQEVVIGAVGYEELKSKVDNVRKCGKAACS
jgi:protein-disulfide isomerase